MAVSTKLRKCYKDNGPGLFQEEAGRVTKDSDRTSLFGRLAVRKRGGGAAQGLWKFHS